MEELDFDVIVVGGGPAGSSTARMAAENGCTVALIEKEKEIAETVRTSGVTWISDIKKFEIPDECYNPIKKFSFCSPKNSVVISDNIAKFLIRVIDDKKRKTDTHGFMTSDFFTFETDEENFVVLTINEKGKEKKDVHSYMLEHQVFHVALNKYSKKTPRLTY